MEQNKTLFMNFQAFKICNFKVSVGYHSWNGESMQHRHMFSVRYARHGNKLLASFPCLELIFTCDVTRQQTYIGRSVCAVRCPFSGFVSWAWEAGVEAAFKLPYVYDYIAKLCRQQAEVIQNHENENIRNIGQGEVWHRKYKRLELGGGEAYDRSCD
jgi:hypothetical protein